MLSLLLPALPLVTSGPSLGCSRCRRSSTTSFSSSGGVTIPIGVDEPPVDSFGAGEELASSSAPPSSCCSSEMSVDVFAAYRG